MVINDSPDALDDIVNKVVTPSVVLPATDSTSIQNDTHDTTTMSVVGKYVCTRWNPMALLMWYSAFRQL